MSIYIALGGDAVLIGVVHDVEGDLGGGEWFELRLRARGSHIEVWINGELVVDAHDATYAEGYIFLQQHHRTALCEFRHIRIREL